MKVSLVTLFMLLACWSDAQEFKSYHKVNSLTNEIFIIAENPTIMPYTVKVEVNFKGMKTNERFPLTRVIEAGLTDTLAKFTPEPGKSIKFGFNTTNIEGNVLARHDDKHVYQLPYKRGTSYKIDQGYNGKSTHQNKNALDFNMDEGTEICAVRDGLVVRTVDEFKKGCLDESCGKFNNFILILHEDGSYADYSHLQRKGVLVSVGDRVVAGQVIGLSGKTGIASGPHLHLEIYTMGWDGQQSVPAKYMVNGKATLPKEGMSYIRN